MLRFENDCVGCPEEWGCIGDTCRYRHVPTLYCDKCGEESETLYEFDGKDICIDCLEDAVDIRDYADIPKGEEICHSCVDSGRECSGEDFAYSDEDGKWICFEEFLKEHGAMDADEAVEREREEQW